MVSETYEAYAINSAYANVSVEENIREGVLSFRAFLCRLYDVLYAKGDIYDNSKKVAHEYEKRTTLSVYYPFLHNVSIILMNIGYHGMPSKNEQSLVCQNTVLNGKLSVTKNLECLQFLADCGIGIDGIDINEKKQNLSDIKTIKITYPDNPIMLKYCYKRKDLWGINASLNNGYHINVKSTKTNEYTDTIKTFPPILQELIAKGYGCGRKREIGHCDGGCRGLPISLDDSVLHMRDDIQTWFDQELSCLQKK